MPVSPVRPARRTRPVVFVHGAGRSGSSAWPGQRHLTADWDCRFLERLTVGDDPDAVVTALATRLDSSAHLVGHSYGGLTALLVATTRPDLVASLTLVEPAALAVSASAPRTAAHIAALSPVFALAGDVTVSAREFATLFASANGTPVPEVSHEVLEGLTAQLRGMRPPWTVAVDATVVSDIPTLVLIGDDDGMYAEVAEVLRGEGARVHVLADTGHRPHDSEEATALMVAHWHEAPAQP